MTSAAFPGTASPAALTQLHRLMSELGRGLDLEETLRAVVDCVVAGLGFGVAVVSVVRPGGDLQVAAVAGDPDARATLGGSWSTRKEWDRLLGLGTQAGPAGMLRLIDHRSGDVWLEESIPSWVPAAIPAAPAAAAPPVDAEPAWHPLDALFAPLVSPTEGLLGVLSVDVPVNGRWPSTEQLGLLEMFAVQAAVAVEHSRLHSVILAAKEQARAALAVRLRSVVDASPAALVEIDRAGDVREWNRAAALLFGEEAADVLGRPLPALFGEVNLARVFATLDGGGNFPMLQLRCRRRDGSEVDVELSAAPTLGPQGEVHGVMGLMVDVTERRELQARLERQATHDDLTGLPNRLLLTQRLELALAAATGCTAVLVLDLDRFKEVNDTLGHHHGDLLLAAVGPRLARVLRPLDTLARLSGDEFAVVLPELADPAAAALVAARVLEALHEPFDLDGVTVDMEASVGVAVSPQDGTDPGLLLRRADIARYQAKELSAGVVSYHQERGGQAPGRLALLGELRRALEGDELIVHYQPKIDIGTGLLCGMEALVRWQHPTRGLLSPADFVPVAENTGLVTRLTLRVLDLVLAQLHEWAAVGEAVPVAVNLSARCLHDLTLPDAVAAALARYAVPPGLLRIEITESAIMSDPVRALAILQRLADGGVRLSIDDFGTGYSSMTYLRQLPVDELKVDQSFVSDLSGALSDQVLVRSAVDLGHNLGLSVVAEGVEDAPTLAALRDLGCDIAQGYLFARPMPASALPAWREQHRAYREARVRPRTPHQRTAPPAGAQVPSP